MSGEQKHTLEPWKEWPYKSVKLLKPEDYRHALKCVNILAGYNTEAVEEAIEALRAIVSMAGQTLLGGDPDEDDLPRELRNSGAGRAHELGANKAFEQCAQTAKSALIKLEQKP